jgi:hypothetical protein
MTAHDPQVSSSRPNSSGARRAIQVCESPRNPYRRIRQDNALSDYVGTAKPVFERPLENHRDQRSPAERAARSQCHAAQVKLIHVRR